MVEVWCGVEEVRCGEVCRGWCGWRSGGWVSAGGWEAPEKLTVQYEMSWCSSLVHCHSAHLFFVAELLR